MSVLHSDLLFLFFCKLIIHAACRRCQRVEKAKRKRDVLKNTSLLLYPLILLPLQLLDAVLFVELINTAAGVDQLLLAGIERMALGADFYGDILLRAAGLIYSAAGAADGGGFVIRMDAFLHCDTLLHHVLP